MIETKEAQWSNVKNVNLTHNRIYVCTTVSGSYLNPFYITNGTTDPMGQNSGCRIGDKISVKGLKIKAFFENSLQRPKVFFRVMLVKCPKGEIPTDSTFFKGDSANKMIDVVNTERFTILAQKKFNIKVEGSAPPNSVGALTGVSPADFGSWGGRGTRIVNMWIPGRKFGKFGNLQYENLSPDQLKFFDYRIVILVYDWYGTPETNQVGLINELYTKVYFKDA